MTAKKAAKPGTKLIPQRDDQPQAETDILADLIYRVVMRLLNGQQTPTTAGQHAPSGGLLSTILRILLGGR